MNYLTIKNISIIIALENLFYKKNFKKVVKMRESYMLPEKLNISFDKKKQIKNDYEKFSDRFPSNVEKYILDNYNLDISSNYNGYDIKNPFGKAPGQLSINIKQVQNDLNSGLGFVVLKSVSSVNPYEKNRLPKNNYKKRKMKVEKIISKSGREGWTVTWKGVGWPRSFEDYLEFMEKSLKLSKKHNTLVVPSCQFKVPNKYKNFDLENYKFTTESLIKVWENIFPNNKLPLEIDFSPTVWRNKITTKEETLYYYKKIPDLIKNIGEDKLKLGVKILNTPFSDEFQVSLLEELVKEESIDWIIVFNRLFDFEKKIGNTKGVAYGGYDLSDRNLKVLSLFRKNNIKFNNLSGTGNINSGKMMVEYALRGCQNGQLHTFFQLPTSEYKIKNKSISLKALHELLFNPEAGLIITLIYLKENFNLRGRLKFSSLFELQKN